METHKDADEIKKDADEGKREDDELRTLMSLRMSRRRTLSKAKEIRMMS